MKRQLALPIQRRLTPLGLKRIVLIFILALLYLPSYGQTTDKQISLHYENAPLSVVLKQFSNESGYKINYSSEDVKPYKVSVNESGQQSLVVLRKILNNTPFTYDISGNFITIVKKSDLKEKRKSITIKGKIVDANGEPLPGANVKCLNSPFGGTADNNGVFFCKVLDNSKSIEVSYVGMRTEIVPVGDDITVVMREDERQIDNIVVTGYQRVSKKQSTASYGYIDQKQLTTQLHTDLPSSLEGKISGLRMEINPNTGEMSPILRGVATFSSNVGTDPLIVIDDMPTNMSLSDINQYNVESITVLKDAAAASIYGALAANGVIVISTKKAEKSGVQVSVNADWFISTKPTLSNLNIASTSDIIDYQTDIFNLNVADKGSAETFLSSYRSNYYNPLYQLYLDKEKGNISDSEVNSTLNSWRGNDYYNEYRENAWRTAFNQRYNLSLSQKLDNSNHFFSFNYENDKDRIITDRSNNFSLYYKSNYNVTKWLDLNAGIDAKLGKDYSPYTQYTSYTLQQRYEKILNNDGSHYTSPFVNVSGYSGGAYNGSTVSQFEGNSKYESFGFNVLDALDESITKRETLRMRPFVSLKANFLKMFKYNFMFQYEFNKSKSELYDSESSYLMRMTHNSMIDSNGTSHLPEGGRLYQYEAQTNRYTIRNQVDFDKKWKSNAISVFAGLEFRENKVPKSTSQLMYGYDPQTLTSDLMDWQSYKDGVGTSAITGSNITLSGLPTTLSEVLHRYASFYANMNYSYKSRYLASGSIRWDQADLFGLDIKNQRHPLYSLGASWIMSEEEFMKSANWIDYLKLRLTYGVNGNVDQSSTTYFVVSQKTQSNPIKSTYLTFADDDLPNPKLRWEKTATTNVGADFNLFNNVINGSLEFYNRVSSDLLVRKYMDPTIGAKSRVINNGKMRNRGVELSLTANIVNKKDWVFSINGNFAHNNNKMLQVDHSDTDVASSFIKSPTNYFIEGTSYNTLWAYKIDRIENGYPIAVDKDGEPMITFNEDGTIKSITTSSSLKGTDDLVNMGSIIPKYNGSFNFMLRYKSFELNALFVYSGGNKLRADVVSINDQAGSQTIADIANRWSESSAEGVRMYFDIPSQSRTYAGTLQDWWQYGDINVKNAGYVKMRSLSLGYNLPTNVCKHLSLRSLTLKMQVNNLFTLCRAGNNIDPETYSANSGSRNFSLPKTLSIGLSTNF